MVAPCMVTPCIHQRQTIYKFSIICLNRLPWLSLNIQTVVFLISGDVNRLEINRLLTHFQVKQIVKGWFPYDRRRSRIADRRSQKVLRSSAIIWKPTSAIVCDRLRSCDRDRRRSQKIERCSIFCDLLRSSAIVCDRLRSCDHMETKVLRSAIETYPIIILILTQMIQNFLATKPECSFMFVTVLSETRSSLSSVWKAPTFCLFMNIFQTQN